MSDTSKEWFIFLGDIMKDTPESEEKVIHRDAVRISIRKETDVGEPVFAIYIFEGENKEPHEAYVIGEEGMYDMYFQYPSLVDIPVAPIDFPAYMTREERKELQIKRAQCVVDFIKKKLDA